MPRIGLTAAQLEAFRQRISALEHTYDKGPCRVWDVPSYSPNLYAVVENATGEPVGVLHAAGPDSAIDVGWWLDSRYRGRGHGSEAVDLLASLLKKRGVTGVGRILIDTHLGAYQNQSSRLISRFKAHFR